MRANNPDGQVSDRGGAGQAPAGRFPFGDDAGLLHSDFLGAILAQHYIAPAPKPIGESDDTLP
jgi:hypothetical protein